MLPLLGPHGSGLTNAIFMAQKGAVVEFGLRPHIDRVFGHVAVALGHDYWHVPHITTFYYMQYTMDAAKAEVVATLVRHILRRNGKGDLLVDRDEL